MCRVWRRCQLWLQISSYYQNKCSDKIDQILPLLIKESSNNWVDFGFFLTTSFCLGVPFFTMLNLLNAQTPLKTLGSVCQRGSLGEMMRWPYLNKLSVLSMSVGLDQPPTSVQPPWEEFAVTLSEQIRTALPVGGALASSVEPLLRIVSCRPPSSATHCW